MEPSFILRRASLHAERLPSLSHPTHTTGPFARSLSTRVTTSPRALIRWRPTLSDQITCRTWRSALAAIEHRSMSGASPEERQDVRRRGRVGRTARMTAPCEARDTRGWCKRGHTGGLAVDAPRVVRTDLTETTRSMCLLVRNGGGVSRLLGSAAQQTSSQTRCLAVARVFAKNQPQEEPGSPEQSLAVSPPRPAPSSPTASLPLNPCLPPLSGSIPIAKQKHHVNEPARKMQCPPVSARAKEDGSTRQCSQCRAVALVGRSGSSHPLFPSHAWRRQVPHRF